MNIKICILNVPNHGNKHDLIHFVTITNRLALRDMRSRMILNQ